MKRSPGRQFVNVIWKHATKATRAGWSTYNQALRRALELAVQCGMEFAPRDMQAFWEKYRGHFWMGGGDNGTEWIYSTAVACSNVSAAKSYESWQKRKPFLYDQILGGDRVSIGQGRSTHKIARLHVGARFLYDGCRWHVGSFAKDNSYVNAQQREEVHAAWGTTDKLTRRRKISREELDTARLERARAKRAPKAEAAEEKGGGDA